MGVSQADYDIAEGYSAGWKEGLQEAANLLRGQINAENDQAKREAFIEASNAILNLIKKDNA